MLNMDTAFRTGRATARNLPSGVTLMVALVASAPEPPKGNGDPATWLRAPFAAMLYTVMVVSPFAATRNSSFGVVAKEIPALRLLPMANGEPGTGVSAPVAGLIEKALTLLLRSLAAKRNSLAVVMLLEAKPTAPLLVPPVRNGEPGTGVNAPLAATEKADTLLPEEKVRLLLVYTKVPWAGAVKALICVRQISVEPSGPMYSLAEKNVL